MTIVRALTTILGCLVAEAFLGGLASAWVGGKG